MKRITRSAIVEHSAGELYALVEDIETYPGFLPWCVEARVLERNSSFTKATITAGNGGVRQTFTQPKENHPRKAIAKRRVERPFRAFVGARPRHPPAPAASPFVFRSCLSSLSPL